MVGLKPIQPKGLAAAYKKLPGAVKKGLRAAAEQAITDFEQTTATWKHGVAFTISGDAYELVIGTDDDIWNWIDQGTRPHMIAPRGKFLRFSPGGRPKSSPGTLRSGSGSRGSGVVYARRVRHPGIKARTFSETIRRRWARGTQPFIRAAIEEALG